MAFIPKAQPIRGCPEAGTTSDVRHRIPSLCTIPTKPTVLFLKSHTFRALSTFFPANTNCLSIAMAIAPHEAHQIAVHAGQGEIVQLAALVRSLAEREGISPAQILISSKDDFQQTAAHMAAKAGQIRKSY